MNNFAGLPQQPSTFSDSADIGAVKIPGSTVYNATDQQYTLSGAGTNMWLKSDEFHFAWKRIKGDFILRARVKFVGSGVDPHRKIGCIVRRASRPNPPTPMLPFMAMD